jgi:hypothetical protein
MEYQWPRAVRLKQQTASTEPVFGQAGTQFVDSADYGIFEEPIRNDEAFVLDRPGLSGCASSSAFTIWKFITRFMEDEYTVEPAFPKPVCTPSSAKYEFFGSRVCLLPTPPLSATPSHNPREQFVRRVAGVRRSLKQAEHTISRLSESAKLGEDDAIETVYREIHQLIENNDYETMERILNTLYVERYTNAVLLSVLTITGLSEVEKRLPSRYSFYVRVKERLADREGTQVAEELLLGLE